MKADEVRQFLEGRKIYIFEPETRALVAVATYELGGRVSFEFSAGDADVGVYGFDGDGYWTRYEKFRDGERHVFHLEALGPGIAQAYFADGRKAFLQSQSRDLSEIAEL